MLAGWHRTGLRRHRRVRQVPPQGTWCQDAWFPALALTCGRHLPRCPLGCKFAGVPSQAAPRPGRKFQWPIVLQPYGRCQRRDGLDTQIRHNGKLLWASPGPVRGQANAEPEVIRASRAMRGVHPSASLACPPFRQLRNQIVCRSCWTNSARNVLSLFQTGTNKIPAGGTHTCSPGESHDNAQLRGGLAAAGHVRPGSGHEPGLPAARNRYG